MDDLRNRGNDVEQRDETYEMHKTHSDRNRMQPVAQDFATLDRQVVRLYESADFRILSHDTSPSSDAIIAIPTSPVTVTVTDPTEEFYTYTCIGPVCYVVTLFFLLFTHGRKDGGEIE